MPEGRKRARQFQTKHLKKNWENEKLTSELKQYFQQSKKFEKDIEKSLKNLWSFMKNKKEKVYAFIDSNNLNLGIQSLGWKLDFRRFRIYLREKYNVSVAYLFIGYVPTNQDLYSSLQKTGYVLIFRPTLPDKDGKVKGNIDADLVLQAMIDYSNYDKVVIVTSDGDFYSLVKYLYENNKLKVVMSPYTKTCSALLKKSAKERIVFMDNLRKKLEYKPPHQIWCGGK